MGTYPLYLHANVGEDILKPSKVIDKKLQKFDAWNNNNNNKKKKKNNNKNTNETLQEQKDIPITWGCPN